MVEIAQPASYDVLKKLADEPVNSHILEKLKDILQIESFRRREQINNITELLDYLERRDELSVYNVDPLQEIAEHCGNERLLRSFKTYVVPKQVTASNPVNQYHIERLADDFHNIVDLSTPIATLPPAPPNVPTPYPQPFTEIKRTQVYKVLSEFLGSYWRRFGRELKITEGAMDNIELKYPRDLPSRVYNLLQLFEEDPCHDPRKNVLLICRALDDCKRKDLRRKVEDIMSY